MSVIRPPSTTVYVLPACQSPLALVIRRGPSKTWHFMLWNRDTGALIPGSWFDGMIYPSRCDLSPRGDMMAIVAYRGTASPHAWTALCRPPFVKALTFWPQDSAKVGGAMFDGRSPVLWLNLDVELAKPQANERTSLEYGYLEPEQPAPGNAIDRLERDGWKRQKGSADPIKFLKRAPKSAASILLEFHGTEADLLADGALFDNGKCRYALVEGESVHRLDDASWVGWNSRGELCIAQHGSLYVTADPREPWQLVANLTTIERPVRSNGTAPPSADSQAVSS